MEESRASIPCGPSPLQDFDWRDKSAVHWYSSENSDNEHCELLSKSFRARGLLPLRLLLQISYIDQHYSVPYDEIYSMMKL